MKKVHSMRAALENPDLLGTILPGRSWQPWRILLIAAMGEKLTMWERRTFKKLTGRSREPGQMVDTFEAVVGRRGGKTRAGATLACYTAALIDYSDVQAIGERLKVLCLARDQKQAGVAFNYIAGIFDTIPLFREMVVNRTVDMISLSNGLDIEVKTASASGLRGFSCASVIADECAFWQTDSASANADTEILAAVRPSLATTGGPLLILSSPHARKGEVFDIWDKHFGHNDPDILVCHGASRDFNSSLPQAVIDRALQRNPIAARAEYLGEFRSDLEGFVSLDTLRACTGQFTERPPMSGVRYTAGLDLASGSGLDSLALAIAHHDPISDRIIVDLVKEWAPPFSPSGVLSQVADICRTYNVETVIGDRFAFNFGREILRDQHLNFRVSNKDTSGCFGELLPMLNAHEVELVQHQVLLTQLGAMECKPSSRGRTFYDHAPGAHNDVAAATAVAVTHCAMSTQLTPVYAVAAAGPGFSGHESGRTFADYLQAAEARAKEEAGMSAEEVRLHRHRLAMLGPNYRERGLVR
jgi:hypothetical protein